MLMKYFFIGLLAVISQPVAAQTAVTGKWKFKDIDRGAQVDSASAAMARSMFGETTMNFRPDQTYHVFMLRDDRGKWRYHADTKKITLTSDKGSESEIDFKLLTDSTAFLAMGRKGGIIMMRVPLTQEDSTVAPVPVPRQLVSITPSQLAKKWFITGRFKPGASQEAMDIAAKMIKGSFFKFDTDGKYKAEVLRIEEEGDWKLEQNNQVLVLSAEGEKRIWKIKSVTETVLELYKGNSEEVWKFSTVKD